MQGAPVRSLVRELDPTLPQLRVRMPQLKRFSVPQLRPGAVKGKETRQVVVSVSGTGGAPPEAASP